MDKNTVIATILILLIWVAWGNYFQPKPPANTKPVQTAESQNKSDTVAEAMEVEKTGNLETKTISKQEESFMDVDNNTMSFQISSKGMGLKDIVLKNYTDRQQERIKYYEGKSLRNFETRINERDIYFDIRKISSSEFLGSYEDENIKVEKIYNLDMDKYTIQTNLKIHNKSKQDIQVENYILDITKEEPDMSIFKPSFEKQEIFVYANNEVEREVYHLDELVNQDIAKASIIALSSHYFTRALIDYSDFIPNMRAFYNGDTKETIAKLIYPKTSKEDISMTYKSYIGPKKFNIVGMVDERFSEVVDYGFFSGIAKPILRLLVYLYDLMGNYGFAIIVLTILVRMAVLPFNVMSYKSMKKMQVIQPIIQKIREKHKDDPMKMNQEVMAVMKENKANPMGGCLPMFLQLPIFFALYQVLGQSIELYQAPFIFWIQDLSLKDPYFVLPVLMGITMYLQQKFTPTALDPTQAKVMMFLPVVFSLMMVALPSGLTLYIFISTLFAVIQQKILMKTV